jgi:hypothetical protein
MHLHLALNELGFIASLSAVYHLVCVCCVIVTESCCANPGVSCVADVRSKLLRPLADSCVEVYTAASAALLPTPSRSHYTFNFRDVVKVMQVREVKACVPTM